MRLFEFRALTIVLGVLLYSTLSFSADDKRPYSGDLSSRSTLTGDWGGFRNELAKKGVTFDLSLTQIEQGVVDGGKEEEWEYGGRGEFNLNINTQKLGLWPGGFIKVEAEGNWEDAANGYTGALMPVNTNQIFPLPGKDELCVPEVSFTQFLSGHFGLTIGKFDTTSGDMNDFAHGKGDDQFFNTAFNLNPVVLVALPYSTVGAGGIILPVKENPDAAIISILALSADGQPNTSGFDDLANGNNVYAGGARLRTDFLDHTGHQSIGAGYSTKTFTSIDQSTRFLIENREIEKENDSWAVFYNFDQYLVEEKKGSGKGIGIFGRFGVSDGNPNPMEYFYSIGFGGKGFISCRPDDGFGIGYYYLDINQPKFTGPIMTRTVFKDEQGFEAYYNIGIAPWMQITPDIQVVKGAQEYQRASGIPIREKIHTATVFGLRFKMIF
ncbi:MAG: carbohydrate porin [Desulfobacterales bacterium]|jgi:porin|nr:carbohydrate porin [Desulfobacterales bacterium]